MYSLVYNFDNLEIKTKENISILMYIEIVNNNNKYSEQVKLTNSNVFDPYRIIIIGSAFIILLTNFFQVFVYLEHSLKNIYCIYTKFKTKILKKVIK